MENELKEKLCDRMGYSTQDEFAVIRQMAWDAYLADPVFGKLSSIPNNKLYLYRAADMYFTASDMREFCSQRRINKQAAQETAQG